MILNKVRLNWIFTILLSISDRAKLFYLHKTKYKCNVMLTQHFTYKHYFFYTVWLKDSDTTEYLVFSEKSSWFNKYNGAFVIWTWFVYFLISNRNIVILVTGKNIMIHSHLGRRVRRHGLRADVVTGHTNSIY